MRKTWLLACALLVGCHGAPDISGIYQASSHTEDTTGCGPGAPVNDLVIFRTKRILFFDQLAYTYEPCVSTQPATCLDFGLLSVRFTEPTGDGWTDDTWEATPSSAGCVLGRSVSTATVKPGAVLRVEFTKYSLTTTNASSCSYAAAKAQASAMSCISDEVIVATRVGPP